MTDPGNLRFIPGNAAGTTSAIASDFNILLETFDGTADGVTGLTTDVLHLGQIAGTDKAQLTMSINDGVGSAPRVPGGEYVIPNIAQQFYYHHQIASGSAPSATILVPSYRVPNRG
jgi:hypothetical protein